MVSGYWALGACSRETKSREPISIRPQGCTAAFLVTKKIRGIEDCFIGFCLKYQLLGYLNSKLAFLYFLHDFLFDCTDDRPSAACLRVVAGKDIRYSCTGLLLGVNDHVTMVGEELT